MVRKCRGIAETAVVEMAAQVGVRTRARAALAKATATSGTASKRRKVGNTSSPLKFSSSPPNAGLSSQRCVVIAQQEEDRCTSHPSSGEASASCCSSNGSSELAKEFVDLEVEGGEVERWTHYGGRERAEADMLESTARPSTTEEADSGHGPTATESELEDFFGGAEKEIQKRFADKYNYDIAKDEPLEDGRYEWARLKKKINKIQ